MNYQNMIRRRAALATELEGILATVESQADGFTDEQRERADAITAEVAKLSADIARVEASREAIRTAPAEPAPAAGHDARVADSVKDLAETRPWGDSGRPAFGAFLQAVYRAGAGFGIDPRLNATASGMGENGGGADGAFAVPMEFAAGIEKEMWDTGQIMSRVNQRPIQGNAITFNVIRETSRQDGYRRGGVQAYWVDEGTAPDASAIKLAQVEMKLRKLGALGYISEELMSDAPALAAELEEAFREEILFEVEDSFMGGTGAGQPQGVLKANCLVTVSKETGQSPDTIAFENIQKMWARMPASSRGAAAWFIHYDVEPQLNSMALVIGAGGVPVYLPPGGLSATPYGTLMGRPVIPTEYNQALGDKGDIILADWSRYRAIRKGGIESTQSMHVRFSQGEMAFRAFYRVDGQAIPRAAITPKNGSNTLSPFVTLEAR